MKSILDSIEISSEYIGNAVWLPFGSFRSDKWQAYLYRSDKKIKVEFLGEGHNGRKPELREVIFVLINEARAGELSFWDFCREYDYNTDSMRAFSAWQTCQLTREKLGVLFSPAEIEQLEVEFADY